MRKVIFRCLVGSHLYGLNTEDSDTDYISVFLPDARDVLGLKKVEQLSNSTKPSSNERRNTAEDVDDTSYSLEKYLRLLLGNNPNILETLFAPKEVISITSPFYFELVQNEDKMVSQSVRKSFWGYAESQIKKIEDKRKRYKSLEDGIKEIEFLLKILEPGKISSIGIDIVKILNKIIPFYKGTKGNTESFHPGMDLREIHRLVKQEYENYGWRVKTSTFDKLGYDVKFGYHAIRLLIEGKQLMTKGRLEFPFYGEDKELLLSVKKGEVDIDKFYELCDNLKTDYQEIEKDCSLPEEPDWEWANDFLIETMINHLTEYADG